MNRALISCFGLLFALVALEQAKADEDVVKPRRERAVAPQRAAPQRAAPTQTSNWSGGQVGGSNGVSSVNNNFVEPGAYVCPTGSTIGTSCFETPFQFSGHKAAYTIGPFVGYRVQFGSWVVGLEGDWSYKNSETSSEPGVRDVDLGFHSERRQRLLQQLLAHRPILRLRQAEVGLLDPRPRGHARHAVEPAVCHGRRRVRRNQRVVCLLREPLLLLGQRLPDTLAGLLRHLAVGRDGNDRGDLE